MTAMGRFDRVARFTVVLAAALLVAASAGSAQEKAAADGIKVHGHWTIDVKNPDGTLASHHEFENALVQSGQNLLSSVLAHTSTVVGWAVFVRYANGSEMEVTCEPQAFSGPFTWPNLVVTTPNSQQVVLEGSVIASGTDAVATVQSWLAVQANGQPSINVFSERALPQPIAVQYNQIVQVKVVFSFS